MIPERAPLSRRALQVAVAVFSLVPVIAGLAGMIMGPAMIVGAENGVVSMDSHYRYLSGLLMGIGLGFWTTVPGIQNKTARFRMLAGIVILGGFGRLYSAVFVGVPTAGMCFGLGMELIVVPVLVLWQGWVTRHSD